MVKGDRRRTMARTPAQMKTARCLAEASRRCAGRPMPEFQSCRREEIRACMGK